MRKATTRTVMTLATGAERRWRRRHHLDLPTASGADVASGAGWAPSAVAFGDGWLSAVASDAVRARRPLSFRAGRSAAAGFSFSSSFVVTVPSSTTVGAVSATTSTTTTVMLSLPP